MLAEPNLATIVQTLEGFEMPVIAAISGFAMGGGLELALGCHFRVAHPDAQISLPEVKLGLLTGGGGTQRLPCVMSVEVAVNMIASGEALPAAKFKGTALFDEVVEGDVVAAALALAAKIAAEKRPLKRVRDIRIDFTDADAFFAVARNTVKAMAGPLPAPLACLECVYAAARNPFDEGIAVERRLFMELMMGPESRALRHAFFGERAAAKIPAGHGAGGQG